MSVATYQVKVIVQAMLWRGIKEDFTDSFRPDHLIDPDGTLHIYDDGQHAHVAYIDEHYVIKGTTGNYFTVPCKDFEREYEPT